MSDELDSFSKDCQCHIYNSISLIFIIQYRLFQYQLYLVKLHIFKIRSSFKLAKIYNVTYIMYALKEIRM